MRVPRRVPFRRRLAAGACGRLLRAAPPALQRTLAGNSQTRMQLRQTDPDEASTPGGVSGVQVESLLDEVIVGRQAKCGRSILRWVGLATLPVELADKVLHSTQRKMQTERNCRTIQSTSTEGSNALTQR
jgi:hypothetical protein